MPFSFECPYCGEVISESDDLEYILLHKLCPECEASFDDDELEELLPEEDLIDDNGEYGYGEGDDDDDEDSSDADLDDGLVDDVDEDDDSDPDSDSDSNEDEDADDDEEP
jgi:clumping factor B